MNARTEHLANIGLVCGSLNIRREPQALSAASHRARRNLEAMRAREARRAARVWSAALGLAVLVCLFSAVH